MLCIKLHCQKVLRRTSFSIIPLPAPLGCKTKLTPDIAELLAPEAGSSLHLTGPDTKRLLHPGCTLQGYLTHKKTPPRRTL